MAQPAISRCIGSFILAKEQLLCFGAAAAPGGCQLPSHLLPHVRGCTKKITEHLSDTGLS